MAGRVLLVIDMLHDFVDPEGTLFCGKAAREILPIVSDRISEFSSRGEPVIYINDAHEENDLEFERFPPHCVVNTGGAALVPEVTPEGGLPDTVCVVEKRRFSGFFGTGLEQILRDMAPDEVHVVGVCTNICVLYTVEELRNRDYPTVVHRAGVASFDEGAHEWALEQMKNVMGARVL